jgi:altronate dehydratase
LVLSHTVGRITVNQVRLVLLDLKDNVATAAHDLHAGQVATAAELAVEVREDIPRGHKVALRPIGLGENVIRYGEVIGCATSAVEAGRHVHVHNLISKRLPGGGR